MEGSGLSSRMYTNMGGGMLGLEMPINPPQNTQIHHHQKHPQIMGFTPHQPQQMELSMKQPNYSYTPNQNQNPPPQKVKTQVTQFTTSDEDEPSCANDQENSSFEGKRKSSSNSSMSLWHRMKWTDNMVRLLIMAVYYIGDEAGGSELVCDKKKPGSGGSGGSGLLQKKGKWKSVSRAMMEKGFKVSPQQCEDKFNDLNKRYKRVNDILGKGTACKVVENQSLLESMELSAKMKEEVKKLLNSKHLFFREMCAYHNSCGHATNGAPSAATVGHANTHVEPQPQHNIQQLQQQQSCLQHSAQIHQQSSAMMHNNATGPHRLGGLGMDEEHDEDESEGDNEDEDDEFDDEEEHDHHQEEGGGEKKRPRIGMQGGSTSQALQQWNGEVVGMLQDGSKSAWEKKKWVMVQMVELEEQGVKYQYQALELEKQRLKWIKFSSKKEREMERMKIDNERKRLENERMLLLLRRKEIEMLMFEQQQQQHPSNNNPSCVST